MLLRKKTDTFFYQRVIIYQICSYMCWNEETFCSLPVELMELVFSLPRPSSVMKFHHFLKGTSSVPVPSKLELVPELGTFSSVTQHHCAETYEILF